MAGDIFDKDPSKMISKLTNDAGDVWPEMPLVVFAFSLSCLAEWLAGISGEPCVEGASEWFGVEGGDIGPDWCWLEITGVHSGAQDFLRVLFPLDKAARVESRLCEHESHIKSSAACAE